MVRRLCILCFLLALWPGLALAQSAALMEAYNQYKALNAQGRYAEAEPFARKALELGQREIGPDHPNTGILLNNLALLYAAQGRYIEAESLYRLSLTILEKELGPEHPSVATSLNNLALVYQAQDRYAEAEPLYQRSRAIREKALGREHPDVAQSLNNRGRTALAAGELSAGAESLPKTKIQPHRQSAIYVTVKNANVRAGPSTGTTKITTLPMGTSVTVLEKAEGGDWYRVARGGAALGYIYGPLIRPQ